MGYESLGAIGIVAILVILIAVWLPRRTVKGMKQVIQHREDRYSTSLHLVDERSRTCFSDIETPKAKGAIMPSRETHSEKNRQYIRQVRAQRRAAVKRRRILCAVLLAAAIVVVVLAFVLKFSPLYALIPAALLVIVLIMGAQASRQARAWEAKMAARMQKDARVREKKRQAARERMELARQANATKSQEQATDVMEVREIRRAIHDTQMEKMRVMQERARLQEAMRKAQQQTQHPIVNEVVVQNVEVEMQPPTDTHESQLVVHTEQPKQRPAAPARTLTTGDHTARNIAQDLISFSLGEKRDLPSENSVAVESMEIQSMKQVAKAQPAADTQEAMDRATQLAQAAQRAREEAEAMRKRVAEQKAQREQAEREAREHEVVTVAAAPAQEQNQAHADQESQDSTASSQMTEISVDVNDSAGFHETESASSVDAPAQSTDSLGSSLDSILARRNG